MRLRILLTTRRETAEKRNPIALLDLAAYWRKQGHRVDAYYLDQLSRLPGEDGPYDLVGLSVLQVLRETDPIRDARFLQKRFRTKVIVGGKWTQTLEDEDKDQLARQGIQVYAGPGEHFFQKEKEEVVWGAYPPWDEVDFQTLGGAWADIMTTRGCPYHCHFCHNTERKISFFGAARTAENIALLFRRGVRRLSFCDDIFTLNPAHMAALYRELKHRRIPIEGRSEFFTHIHHIHPATLQGMKRFQPFQVNVGIESGDDGMLERMGKGFDTETAYAKLKILHEELRVPIGTLFLLGFPGETEESLQNTLRFIRRIRPLAGSWVSLYQPVRGTVGYQLAEARAPKLQSGRRNIYLSYVDPNISPRLLLAYRYRMMDPFDGCSLRSRLIQAMIRVFPTRLLERIYALRQRRRLAKFMERYAATG